MREQLEFRCNGQARGRAMSLLVLIKADEAWTNMVNSSEIEQDEAQWFALVCE